MPRASVHGWRDGDGPLWYELVLIGQAPAGHRNEWPDHTRERPTIMVVALSDRLSYGVEVSNGHPGRAMLVGYARTSTTDQKAGLDAQERDLRAAGADKVFTE